VKHLLTREGTSKGLKVKTCKTAKMMDHEWVTLREKEKPEKMTTEVGEDLKDTTMSTLLLCLINNYIQEVLALTDPIDIWDKLESRYKLKLLISRLYLKKRLFGLQMTEEANFNQRLDESSKLTTKLDSLEVKTEEGDKVLLLLASLPLFFDNMVTALLFGKETLRLDKVVPALWMNETRRHNNQFSNDGQVAMVKKESS